MTSVPSSPRLTDSPWFWLMVFSATAMTAAAIIGPKYAVRMARKERMLQAQEVIAAARSAGVRAGEVEQTRPRVIPYTDDDYLERPKFGWLFGLLTATMLVGAVGMHWSRATLRQRAFNSTPVASR